jgi:murein DD-endopeptidase MepM/ murein hydrolase activator NlpD
MVRRTRTVGPSRIALGLLGLCGAALPQSRPAPDFVLPCDDYRRGLRGKGNFAELIRRKDSVFDGSWHLGEDVWLPAGTEVRSVAAGVVRYSDWSPSWKEPGGRVHWNLGNVVVIEHPLVPAEDGMSEVCSIYVHLAADRRVAVGDRVTQGKVIGRIGKDRSEENGLYPAHLHFGLHRGPYYQIPPSWRRELEEAARGDGIVVPQEPPLKGEIELIRQSESSVLVKAREGGGRILLSLLKGSSAPEPRPADIMSWCSGYGDRNALSEWLCPSDWIAARATRAQSTSRPGR